MSTDLKDGDTNEYECLVMLNNITKHWRFILMNTVQGRDILMSIEQRRVILMNTDQGKITKVVEAVEIILLSTEP